MRLSARFERRMSAPSPCPTPERWPSSTPPLAKVTDKSATELGWLEVEYHQARQAATARAVRRARPANSAEVLVVRRKSPRLKELWPGAANVGAASLDWRGRTGGRRDRAP